MKTHWFVLLLLVAVTGTWSQSIRNTQSTAHDAGSGQRRGELRDALRGAPTAEPRHSHASETQPTKRRLSEQERADLRRLLRQQGAQGKDERP